MAQVSLDIRGIPEVMHAVIRRIVQVLRDQADMEADTRVGDRLREIANQLEVGQ